MNVCTRTTTTTHTHTKGLSWTCAPSVWPEVTCGEYFGRSSIVASGWAVASTPLLNFLYCPWRTSCLQFDSFHTLFLKCDSTEATFCPSFLVPLCIYFTCGLQIGMKSSCAAQSMSDLRAGQREQTALLLVCVVLSCLEESGPALTAKKTEMQNYGGL